jgi:tetratricopeptide (TPR) repeat protein
MKKASVIACLFCFVSIDHILAQSWTFDSRTKEAYLQTLNLEFAKARQTLGDRNSIQEQYAGSLNDALELLLTEDASLFSAYEKKFADRLIKNPKQNDERFLQAELNLQWAFVYLKFGHELDAASHFRDAYKLAMECRRKSPHYLPIRKTTGMLEVMVGAVPEKYNWIMDLFGIHGSIENGLKDLEMVVTADDALAKETRVIKSLIEGYVLQQPATAANDLNKRLPMDSSNALALGAASLYIKSAQSEKAISLLKSIEHTSPIVHYFLGESLLHRGDYQKAIDAYQRFVDSYKGINNVKDAWFKTGICYLLLSKPILADSIFIVAKNKGDDIVEADRSAGRTMTSGVMPNIVLTKARYFTDGGYYDHAREVLSKINDAALKSKKDKVEYYYRRARIEHGTRHRDASKLFYQQVIDMAGEEPWYFAPNACLQMGYLFLEETNEPRAKEFFRKALTYKNHEYRNSIDSKAKTALNRLKR